MATTVLGKKYGTTAGALLLIIETLTLADTLTKNIIVRFTDNVTLAENVALTPRFSILVEDIIALTDETKYTVMRIFTDTLVLTDDLSRRATKIIVDTIALTEDVTTRVYKKLCTAFGRVLKNGKYSNIKKDDINGKIEKDNLYGKSTRL